MAFEVSSFARLVKQGDLNHHGTLFAGRCAEWFVEAGFISVAKKLEPHSIVCLNIHGMEFLHPIHAGDVLSFGSRIVKAGRSTVVVYIRAFLDRTPEKTFCDGFMTFCHVDENTIPRPHGLVIEPETDEEKKLYEKACSLRK